MSPPEACPCCGSRAGTAFVPVMWKALGDEWGLSEDEYAYIDHQQGETCVRCGSNLRTQALALAILRTFGGHGPFRNFARSIRGRLLRILEINSAGQLTCFFPRDLGMNCAPIPTSTSCICPTSRADSTIWWFTLIRSNMSPIRSKASPNAAAYSGAEALVVSRCRSSSAG